MWQTQMVQTSDQSAWIQRFDDSPSRFLPADQRPTVKSSQTVDADEEILRIYLLIGKFQDFFFDFDDITQCATREWDLHYHWCIQKHRRSLARNHEKYSSFNLVFFSMLLYLWVVSHLKPVKDFRAMKPLACLTQLQTRDLSECSVVDAEARFRRSR